LSPAKAAATAAGGDHWGVSVTQGPHFNHAGQFEPRASFLLAGLCDRSGRPGFLRRFGFARPSGNCRWPGELATLRF
ncbi:MAG: hypothetical protein ACK6D3_08655, partial [Planctomycetaceae bacterium]